MRVRALTPTGDWTFGAGTENYLTRNAAVRQNIQTRLSLWLGECFFNLNAGIDWANLLGSKTPEALQLAIATTILNTTDVVGIKMLSVTLNAQRQFSISFKVQTSFSTVIDGTYTYSLNGVAS